MLSSLRPSTWLAGIGVSSGFFTGRCCADPPPSRGVAGKCGPMRCRGQWTGCRCRASLGRRFARGSQELRARRRPVMKVGIALNMLHQPGRSDASVVGEHLAMGDLAEPLGFDSLFALEHHFTGYAMSPAPTQLLSYYAGRTRRITLGTAVIVLPWHDPVRVAEQIALLDIMCGGRCLFGFGRGAASVEYEGFRIPMGEARPRFVEAAQIVVKALSSDSFEHDGEFFQIPRTAVRPRPISNPERRFYASSVSPESAEVIAKLGFGMLMIMQNEWAKCREDIEKFQAMSQAAGFAPKAPIILTNVSCCEDRAEAQDKAFKYLGRKWQSI